jgi:hypothetical protein
MPRRAKISSARLRRSVGTLALKRVEAAMLQLCSKMLKCQRFERKGFDCHFFETGTQALLKPIEGGYRVEIAVPRVAGRSKCTTHSTAGSGGDDGQRCQGRVSAEPKPGRQSLCEPFRAVVEAKLEAGLRATLPQGADLAQRGSKQPFELEAWLCSLPPHPGCPVVPHTVSAACRAGV